MIAPHPPDTSVVTLRMSEVMHLAFKAEARARGLSLNQFCIMAAESQLDAAGVNINWTGDFGGHLRVCRVAKGMSVDALSMLTEIKSSAIIAVERGDRLPWGRPELIEALSTVLGDRFSETLEEYYE